MPLLVDKRAVTVREGDITNGLTLSKAIKDKSTPLRQYLDHMFPNAGPLQVEYKAQAGELVVDTAGAPASTVGTAADLLVRFLLDPEDVPQAAGLLFPLNDVYVEAVEELSRVAGTASRGGVSEEDTFARAIWALSLCIEAHRAGAIYAPFVSELVRAGQFGVTAMLSQASPEALKELVALRAVAEMQLIPLLKPPFYLGPEFDDSKRGGLVDNRLITAEADLICSGLLIDIKSGLGSKNIKTGKRSDSLPLGSLYQLIAYALLDFSDIYGINSVGIYSARYGHLTSWPIDYVMSTMAGQTVSLRAVRQDIRDMLHG